MSGSPDEGLRSSQKLNSSMNRSFSSQRAKSMNKLNRLLNDPNQNNSKYIDYISKNYGSSDF